MPDLLMSMVICAETCTERNTASWHEDPLFWPLGKGILEWILPEAGSVLWNPLLAGPWGPKGRCRELGSAPQSLWGGREGGQSPSNTQEVTGFWQHPQRSTEPEALSAGWPTSDKTICWKARGGNLADFPDACPDFPTQGADLAQAMWAVWFPNVPCHKFHQTGKHCRSDCGLQPTHLTLFECLNQLGCQFPFL